MDEIRNLEPYFSGPIHDFYKYKVDRKFHIYSLEKIYKSEVELPTLNGCKGKINDGKLIYGKDSISVIKLNELIEKDIYELKVGDLIFSRNDLRQIKRYLNNSNGV